MNKTVLRCFVAVSLIAGLSQCPVVSVAPDSGSIVFAADETVKEYGRLSYVENDDGTLTVTDCVDDAVWVSIDGSINGKKITAIAKNAFAGCKSLRYVYIGSDVQRIGTNAFAGTDIVKITIPASVHTIYSNAFSDCKNLTTVCIYSKYGMNVFFGDDVFKGCSDDLTVYCATGSGAAHYIRDTGRTLRQSDYYWVGLPEEEEPETTEPTTEPATESVSPDSSGGAAQPSPQEPAAEPESEPVEEEPVEESTEVPQDNNEEQSLGEKYNSLPDMTKSTYIGNQSVFSDVYGEKIIKNAPPGAEALTYEYTYDGTGYVFERTGMYVSEKDYVILCNCVAQEYGADWVPEWEIALVAEVIFNRYNYYGYSSVYDSIVAPNAFEHSEWYADLDTFSPKVNDRVINAVNTYLSFPEYFEEGYTSFRGDGTWNYFW